jgi:hypothetical protein
MYGEARGADGSRILVDGEVVTQVFGGAGVLLNRIGFRTSMGRIAGPWGGSGGSNSTLNGVVVGFHGAILFDSVASIGVYTLESARVGGITVGSSLFSNVTLWDDGPQYPVSSHFTWESGK